MDSNEVEGAVQGMVGGHLSRSVRVIGSFGSNAAAYPEASTYKKISSWNSPTGVCRPRAWGIDTSCLELKRVVAGAVDQAGWDVLRAQGVERSGLRLRVILSGGWERDFPMDIGQDIEVYAENVSVDLIAPASFQQVSDNRTYEVGGANELVLDTQVGVRISEIGTTIGRRTVIYTEAFNRSAAARNGVIPNGAVRLQAYSGTSGPTAVVWHFGDPNGATFFTLGNDTFTNQQPENGGQVVPAATHWSVASGADQGLVFVWTISP